MPDEPPVPTEQAATSQEAMDTIVQAFDHPPTLQISYSTADGQKRTTLELETGTGTAELTYDGRDDDAEETQRPHHRSTSGTAHLRAVPSKDASPTAANRWANGKRTGRNHQYS